MAGIKIESINAIGIGEFENNVNCQSQSSCHTYWKIK